MAVLPNAREITKELCWVRQARQYRPEPIPDGTVAELLQIARWSGSSTNTQPWHFIVVTDPAQLRQLAGVRGDSTAWVGKAPLAIAIVLDGNKKINEAFDEGRVTERLLIGAHFLGLGGGTAWFGDTSQQAHAKEILGIPAERTARSLVVLGYPAVTPAARPGASGGRKPLAEIVSYDRYREGRE